MKKLLTIVFVSLALAVLPMSIALANSGPAGYYQKTHGGKNIGKVKYFPKGHPDNNSEWVYVGPCEDCDPVPPGPEGDSSFWNDASQTNAIVTYKGNVDDNEDDTYTVNNGAFVSGYNESEAFSGALFDSELGGGIGFSGTIGGTIGGAEHSGAYNLAWGATGNVSAAGMCGADLIGGSGISGEGSLSTIAVSQRGNSKAVANSAGSFSYSASTNNTGILIGGGGTAGFSTTNISNGVVSAAAGQVSVSGAGSIPSLVSPQ